VIAVAVRPLGQWLDVLRLPVAVVDQQANRAGAGVDP
jgi:hypothetical protein